ncbi:MAG: hypothetical protein PHT07_07370 [Paludibacter sp.]|nr:hypothetical protein [Paludibacter sp.]
MKTPLFFILLFFLSFTVYCQTSTEVINGKVSFISSQNVYVKFENTEGILVGDTLFLPQNNKLVPALVVNSMSSISCVGTPLTKNAIPLTTQIVARKRVVKNPGTNKTGESKFAESPNDQAIRDSFTKKNITKTTKARFDGRLAVSSYTNVSSNYTPSERLRYNLTMNADHIGESNLSAETYISYTHLLSFPHKYTDWTGLNNALKIYSLALKYDLDKTSSISLGRRIYNNMSNIGAVDGLEYEHVGKHFTFGALAGSRPDYLDYSFNPKLLQFGAFISHNTTNDNGLMQTSLGVFDQLNNFKTDRRFAYFQHTNSLLKNVDLFSSFEVDLYGFVNNQLTSTFDLTSTYISLRFKPWDDLTTSISYDARKNIYYYETFPRNKIDSTLDKETRQGLRFNIMLRPFNYFVWGGNAGYNLKSTSTGESMNANSYISYSQLPLDMYGTITVTALKTPYLTSMMVYGASLSRDFGSGKFNAQVEYRMGNLKYVNTTFTTLQNIGQMSLFWRIAKKLTVSANFEGTFETSNGNKTNYGSLYLNISQRF